jgi:hypothetical protein
VGRARLRPDLQGLLNLPSYLDTMAGSLEAFFDLTGVDGEVVYEPWPGGARFILNWTPRQAPVD